jgi:RNA polymerase sigma factor (TIGR02999 family)
MSDITRLLESVQSGNPVAGEKLLPLVYEELRAMAVRHMARENPGQTLQPTALVNEAYLRLVGDQQFESRGHFFAAAAQAMRRILVENARRKQRQKRGGQAVRQPMELNEIEAPTDDDELLALHEALEQLASEQPRRAQLVELRFFGGMSLADAAAFLGMSTATADRDWRFARAWLYAEMKKMD